MRVKRRRGSLDDPAIRHRLAHFPVTGSPCALLADPLHIADGTWTVSKRGRSNGKIPPFAKPMRGLESAATIREYESPLHVAGPGPLSLACTRVTHVVVLYT